MKMRKFKKVRQHIQFIACCYAGGDCWAYRNCYGAHRFVSQGRASKSGMYSPQAVRVALKRMNQERK